MLPAVDLVDLIQRVEEQLGRFGVAGRVELDGTTFHLRGHGRTISVAFVEIEGWQNATPEQQARMLERIVRELVRVRRATAAPPPTRRRWLDWLRPLFVLASVAVGIALAWRWLGVPAHEAVSKRISSDNTAPKGVSAATTSPVAPLSASVMCQRVQSRIATGGSVSILDVDGWVVELLLLSSDPTLDPNTPKLDAFFSKADGTSKIRRLAWSEDGELSSLNSPDTWVVVTNDSLSDVIPGTKAGLRITWSGKYVTQYFEEASRVKLQRLAAALYEATGANYGALYARCATGTIHQVGSWFRAKDLPGAVLSLIAAMGLYADAVHVQGADPRTASAIEQRRIWDGLVERAPRLDRQKLTLELSEDGGMIASRPGHWQTVSFPFQDANRATRASLRMARRLGVAPQP